MTKMMMIIGGDNEYDDDKYDEGNKMYFTIIKLIKSPLFSDFLFLLLSDFFPVAHHIPCIFFRFWVRNSA